MQTQRHARCFQGDIQKGVKGEFQVEGLTRASQRDRGREGQERKFRGGSEKWV